MTTKTANRSIYIMRAIAACVALAIGSLTCGIANAAGAPQGQIAVSVTVVRPPVPVVRIIDAQSTIASTVMRQATAASQANGVQYVLVEY